MGYLLYHIVVNIYRFLIWLSSPFNPKASTFVKGRMHWMKKMKSNIPKSKSFTFWIHCASLGEFEQGRPVIEMIRVKHPEWFILMTFFSPSGYFSRKEYDKVDYVMYLPWDSASNARKFMEILNPDLVCFVKYEFWYHFLKESHQRNIPTVLISGIFRREQVFFKWYGTFYRRILRYFSQYFVQNEESVQLLQSLNIRNVALAGDTRIDRVVEIAGRADKFPKIEEFFGQQEVIIVGSAWQDDLDVIVPLINDPEVKFKFIIAPHEINKIMIQGLSESINERAIRYSDCLSGKVIDLESAHVLIIDSVGILSQIYQYGSLAYIGGAFGDGLHSILEPAAFGLPLFFGNKYYDKFHEANDLIALGGAFPVSKSSEFKSKLLYLSEDKERMKETSNIVKNYIYDKAGATQKVVNFFENVGLK